MAYENIPWVEAIIFMRGQLRHNLGEKKWSLLRNDIWLTILDKIVECYNCFGVTILLQVLLLG